MFGHSPDHTLDSRKVYTCNISATNCRSQISRLAGSLGHATSFTPLTMLPETTTRLGPSGAKAHQSVFNCAEEIVKNLYVRNMDQATTEQDLKTAFTTYGPVEAITIIKDRTTGVPRGFAFVEMTAEKDATEAIKGLNGSVMAGRTISVSEARSKTKKSIR